MLCASWLCCGVRDALLKTSRWLHSHGDASVTGINEFILTCSWVSASQLCPLLEPDWVLRPIPRLCFLQMLHLLCGGNLMSINELQNEKRPVLLLMSGAD